MRIIQITWLFLSFVLLLTACGSGESTLATLVPTIAAGDGTGTLASDESPRPGQDAPSSMIPPTWTPGPAPDVLSVQQPVFATRAPDETYIVQPGDTLAEIAEDFGVDLDRLARANNVQNIDFIFMGQVLTIPR